MAKKQGELPGVEKPIVKAVEEAADQFVAAHDRRKTAAEKETTARDILIDAMKRHKLTCYAYDGTIITLEALDKVKVRSAKDEDADVED